MEEGADLASLRGLGGGEEWWWVVGSVDAASKGALCEYEAGRWDF